MAINAVPLNRTSSIAQKNWQLPADGKNNLTNRVGLKPAYPVPFVPAKEKAEQQPGNELLLSLPVDVFLKLQPAMQKVVFERGQTIYDIGDTFDFVYFPIDLVASRLCLMEDGAMIEVGVVGREGLVGISSMMGAATANCLTIAETGGTAIRVRTKLLRDIFRQNQKLQRILLNYYSDFLTQVSQRAACRCRHTVAQQLCTWLLLVHDRASSNDLALTQETIANRLGARRASVTVALNELEKNGCVQSRRGHIIISNRRGLENCACECYDILRSNFHFDLKAARVQ
ncbi:MAG: Crp/Fnr family transcriptional regulator [Acidobacteriota bacterium]|nr:Crp/Fnr family transcriptional regulator [Acidobacteriota bacterium]